MFGHEHGFGFCKKHVLAALAKFGAKKRFVWFDECVVLDSGWVESCQLKLVK
jgi:hypothetical protein